METQTLGQVSPRSVVPLRADLTSAFRAERRLSTAPSPPIFSEGRCWRCREALPSRRRRYCSDRCAYLSHLNQTRAWKRRYRDESGHWPSSAADYWTKEKRRQKNREYARRRREHRRSAAKTKRPAMCRP